MDVDVEKRLEQLHKELQQLDKKANDNNQSITTQTNALINYYTKLCNKAHKKENEHFIASLKKQQFILDVSRMQLSSIANEDDLLSIYLNVLKSKEIISIINCIQIVDESAKQIKIKIQTRKKENNERETAKRNTGLRVFRAIYTFLKNWTKSSTRCELQSIVLKGIQITNKKHWKLFGDIVSKISYLKELTLHNMPLGATGCEILCQSLQNSQINKLTLSCCGLSAKCGSYINRLIAAHANNRLSLKWQGRLRVRRGDASYNVANFEPLKIGLTALDLSQNNLCDRGLDHITNALMTDKWILWIDLRSNNITKHAIIKVVQMLKLNTNILHLDVTQNKNVSDTICAEISNILDIRKRAKTDTNKVSLKGLMG
eukprot:879699_1